MRSDRQYSVQRVLIVGAGVAGTTLAHWLLQYGFEPTVVERAPRLREEGYFIDLGGIGFQVAEIMGLRPELERMQVPVEKVMFQDSNGVDTAFMDMRIPRKAVNGRYMTIRRDELARALYEKTKDSVHYIFGDTVSRLRHEGDGGPLTVHFKSGESQEFDLVVGADGVHSSIRSMEFGAESNYRHPFNMHVAGFNMRNRWDKDFSKCFDDLCAPGKQIIICGSRDNDAVVPLFVFRDTGEMVYHRHDLDAQKRVLAHAFKDMGGKCPEILEEMRSKDDFLFDQIIQIRMPTWSTKRVVLLGDSAFCPTLLSGQGAALAMGGAYILANELRLNRLDYRAALHNYERVFKPFVIAKQESSKSEIDHVMPDSNFGLWIRDKFLVLLAKMPRLQMFFIGKLFARDIHFLRDYHNKRDKILNGGLDRPNFMASLLHVLVAMVLACSIGSGLGRLAWGVSGTFLWEGIGYASAGILSLLHKSAFSPPLRVYNYKGRTALQKLPNKLTSPSYLTLLVGLSLIPIALIVGSKSRLTICLESVLLTTFIDAMCSLCLWLFLSKSGGKEMQIDQWEGGPSRLSVRQHFGQETKAHPSPFSSRQDFGQETKAPPSSEMDEPLLPPRI